MNVPGMETVWSVFEDGSNRRTVSESIFSTHAFDQTMTDSNVRSLNDSLRAGTLSTSSGFELLPIFLYFRHLGTASSGTRRVHRIR